MPKKIAVVILNWNGNDLLQKFLPSIVSHSEDLATVYVIDNASTDASIVILKKEFPSVKIIHTGQNYSYARAYNYGLKNIKEPYLVLLSNAVEVTKNWLTPMLNHLEENPKLGAIQPKILDYKNPEQFAYAGASGGYIDHIGCPFCRGRIFNETEKDKGQYNQYVSTFWATGVSLMVRNEVFQKAGKFNEMLLAHMGDIDLCWRIQNLGYQIACEPKSVIYHMDSATLSHESSKENFLNFRNNLMILFLNLPTSEAFIKIFLRLILDGLVGIKFMISIQPQHTLAIVKAHFSFYTIFPKLIAQKKKITQRPIKSLAGVYTQNIAEDFFLKKRKNFTSLKPKNFRV